MRPIERTDSTTLSRRDALDAAPGGIADRLAARSSDHKPWIVALTISLVGFVVMGGILVGLGFLLTHVLLRGGLGSWDEHVNDWFVTKRTSSFNTITSYGTTVGSTGTVVAVAAITMIVLAIRRLWREVGLILIALTIEVLVFLMTTFLVDRPRPTVAQLDPAPPTSSFPSGHTAAAIALWIALAIVLSVHLRHPIGRTLIWIVGLGLPVFVGLSRLYRGMHHPTDVMGSVVLGCGAILIALLAVRAASRVAQNRRRDQLSQDPSIRRDHAEVTS